MDATKTIWPRWRPYVIWNTVSIGNFLRAWFVCLSMDFLLIRGSCNQLTSQHTLWFVDGHLDIPSKKSHLTTVKAADSTVPHKRSSSGISNRLKMFENGGGGSSEKENTSSEANPVSKFISRTFLLYSQSSVPWSGSASRMNAGQIFMFTGEFEILVDRNIHDDAVSMPGCNSRMVTVFF